MPFVNVKLVKEQCSEHLKKEVIFRLTELIVKEMNRDRNLTNIVIDEVPADSWGIGGKTIEPEETGVSFVNIKVSKGTTHAQEMSNMTKKVKELMSTLLKNHVEANYFIIDELNPEAWGFGNLTMAGMAKAGI